MLTIKLVKAQAKANTFDFKSDLKNRISEDFYNKLKTDLKDFKCDIHPDQESVITVTSTPNGEHPFTIKKECCCDNFSNIIQVDWTN